MKQKDSTAMNETSTNKDETLGSGVTQEWLHNRRIVIYTVPSINRNAIDVWEEAVLDAVANWTEGQPYLAIHDISGSNIIITPYARHRIKKIDDAAQGIKGCYAVVLPRSRAGQLMKIMIRRQIGPRTPAIIKEVFFTREEALEWLEQYL